MLYFTLFLWDMWLEMIVQIVMIIIIMIAIILVFSSWVSASCECGTDV
jgi:hypothetical protein